jgi:RES domain-containing protein
MLAPRWAHEPLSGVGAAGHGGRWNPKGVPALYMSERYAIAIAEYEQELGIRPGTLCAYEVKTRAIADLTKPGVLKSLGAKSGDLTGPWKQIALVERRRPPSWALAERLIAEGVRGVRVPSAQARGVNLVLWRWDDKECQVLDPLGDLPKDQRSWSSKGPRGWRGATRRTTVDERRHLLPQGGRRCRAPQRAADEGRFEPEPREGNSAAVRSGSLPIASRIWSSTMLPPPMTISFGKRNIL